MRPYVIRTPTPYVLPNLYKGASPKKPSPSGRGLGEGETLYAAQRHIPPPHPFILRQAQDERMLPVCQPQPLPGFWIPAYAGMTVAAPPPKPADLPDICRLLPRRAALYTDSRRRPGLDDARRLDGAGKSAGMTDGGKLTLAPAGGYI